MEIDMNNIENSNKRALTIKEAAEYACVSRGTVENWLAKGLLPYEELPGRGKGIYNYRRIRKKDIDEFLNRLYRQSNFSERRKSNSKLILLPRNT